MWWRELKAESKRAAERRRAAESKQAAPDQEFAAESKRARGTRLAKLAEESKRAAEMMRAAEMKSAAERRLAAESKLDRVIKQAAQAAERKAAADQELAAEMKLASDRERAAEQENAQTRDDLSSKDDESWRSAPGAARKRAADDEVAKKRAAGSKQPTGTDPPQAKSEHEEDALIDLCTSDEEVPDMLSGISDSGDDYAPNDDDDSAQEPFTDDASDSDAPEPREGYPEGDPDEMEPDLDGGDEMDGLEHDEVFGSSPLARDNLRFMRRHVQELAGSKGENGSATVGAYNGRGAKVYGVGPRDSVYASTVVNSIPESGGQVLYTAAGIADAPHLSVRTPLLEKGGTNYLVRLPPNVTVHDLYAGNNRGYAQRGWRKVGRSNMVSKALTAETTMPHKYWLKRMLARKSDRRDDPCPCPKCRYDREGPECGFLPYDKFQMKLSAHLGAAQDGKGFQPGEGALIFVEYFGVALAAPNKAHGNAHDQIKGEKRTLKSFRRKAYAARRDHGVKPNMFAVRAASSCDPQQKFSSANSARNAMRNAASSGAMNTDGLSDIEVLLKKCTDEDMCTKLGLKSFVRTLQSVTTTGDDVFVLMYSD
jgi:hypothetical protein